jgi:hypothetical protein
VLEIVIISPFFKNSMVLTPNSSTIGVAPPVLGSLATGIPFILIVGITVADAVAGVPVTLTSM